MGTYDVEPIIRDSERGARITWEISGNRRSPLGALPRLPSRARNRFPVSSEAAPKGTLGILARTVRCGYPTGESVGPAGI